jgi:hypothetical protein
MIPKSVATNERKTQCQQSGSWVLNVQRTIVCQKKLWICLWCHYMDLCQIVLWGTFTFNRMHLLPGIQDTGILWIALFQLGPNLRMGWIPGIQLLRWQIQMLCPLSTLPIRLTCIPHALPMLASILDENSGCMEGTFFWNKKDSINMLYCISFFMCQHPRGEWSGCRTYLETKWGWAWLYWCIMVGPMCLQSSSWEWAPMRFLSGITNDPWHWL